MGETTVRIKVSSLTGEESAEVEVLVDTGATYTAIPETILERLGVERIGKVKIEFANGEMEERDIGNALIEIDGMKRANPVLFAKGRDAVVFGLVTLESCGLTVDPVSRKLVPLAKIHQYLMPNI
jgi:clan AA aspartic protease